MFKAMFFLYRRSDLSTDEFLRYGREVHVPIVASVPGLERYVMHYTAMNPEKVEHACDAIAELWFASPESFQAAVGSESPAPFGRTRAKREPANGSPCPCPMPRTSPTTTAPSAAITRREPRIPVCRMPPRARFLL